MTKKSKIEKLEKKLKKEKKALRRQQADLKAAESQTAVSVINAPQREEGRSTAVSVGNTIMPKSFKEINIMADKMAQAGPMIGKAFQNNPGACMGIITQACRWGMDPFAISQEAHVVNNTLGYSGKLIAAIVEEHAPLKKRLRLTYDGQGPNMTCTVTGHFIGEDEPHVHTSPPIRDIYPQNSPLWKTKPRVQLGYNTVRDWARLYASATIMGIKSAEEAAVEHELDDNRSNSEKRLEQIKERKAAAKAKKEEEDIIDVEVVDEETPPEDPEVVPNEEKQADKPAEAQSSTKASAGTPDLPDEAHDWFEVLESQDDATKVSDMWADMIMPADWFKALTKEQSEEVFAITQQKLNELNGE